MYCIQKSYVFFLQATIHYKSVAKSFKITPSRRKICKPLIRRNFQSFSIKCFENVVTRKAIIKKICGMLRQEVSAICSDNYSTVMRDKNSEALIEFDFAKIIEEMELKTPTLLYLLQNCLKANTPRGNEKAVLAIIASMIFKHRRSSCSLLQRIISLILYAGHTAKQVNC